MNNISKQELISNLQDKISQFKSNFSKIKESRKEVPELNFEINRDALKLFSKKKSDNNEQPQNLNQNKISSKPQSKIDEIYRYNSIFIFFLHLIILTLSASSGASGSSSCNVFFIFFLPIVFFI